MIITTQIVIAGIWTGLLAVLVMTAAMMTGKAMGMAPLDLPVMLGRGSRPLGMVMHLLIGMILGVIYGLLIVNGILLQDVGYRSGMLFSIAPWLLMMILFLPMMGQGLFGLKTSVKVPVMTLLLHLLYGAVLGFSAAL